MSLRFHISKGHKVKIVYVNEPVQIVHSVVAVDADGKRIVATFMTDGEIQSEGYHQSENVLHEVLISQNFKYVVIIDHWIEGPVFVVSSEDAYELLVKAFTCLGFRKIEEHSGTEFRYVVLSRD